MFFLLFAAAGANADGIYLKNNVFRHGETAKFNLYFNWGFIWIHAGDVDFSVQTQKLDGKEVYSLKVIGYTISTFEKMYHIRDTFEAFVDTVHTIPLRYREAKHEGSYYAKSNYIYNKKEDSFLVYMDFIRRKRQWKDTMSIRQHVADLITTCYRVRNLDISKLSKNQIVPFPMLFDDKVYDLGLTYIGKENIELRNGKKYHAHKFTPKLITGDLFKKDEDMTIYVSDDGNHIPLLVEAKIKVGYIKAVLAEAKNTKLPMKSLISK
jgi:hypothetical protein